LPGSVDLQRTLYAVPGSREACAIYTRVYAFGSRGLAPLYEWGQSYKAGADGDPRRLDYNPRGLLHGAWHQQSDSQWQPGSRSRDPPPAPLATDRGHLRVATSESGADKQPVTSRWGQNGTRRVLRAPGRSRRRALRKGAGDTPSREACASVKSAGQEGERSAYSTRDASGTDMRCSGGGAGSGASAAARCAPWGGSAKQRLGRGAGPVAGRRSAADAEVRRGTRPPVGRARISKTKCPSRTSLGYA